MSTDTSAPGLTQCLGDVCKDIMPLKVDHPYIIVIASGKISNENLFSNGLFQNVIVFYHMFEAMGYKPYILFNEMPASMTDMPKCIQGLRIYDDAGLSRQHLKIHTFMEVAMSIDDRAKRQMKMLGTRLLKIYLGNILNIDVEIPLFYPKNDFPHHIASLTDDILVSPHYGQHWQYAQAINCCPITASPNIAPYVWNPDLLASTNPTEWRAPADTAEPQTIVIVEPNISFQKSSIIPLLAMERWYRGPAGRKWNGRVVLYNFDRLVTSGHFHKQYYKRFALFEDGKVELRGRSSIKEITTEWPSATFLAHQVNNEFNYMFLELLWLGFPVVHNVDSWRDFGYYYDRANLDKAATMMMRASLQHNDGLQKYKADARALAWRYSPYNPAIQKAWQKIIQPSTAGAEAAK